MHAVDSRLTHIKTGELLEELRARGVVRVCQASAEHDHLRIEMLGDDLDAHYQVVHNRLATNIGRWLLREHIITTQQRRLPHDLIEGNAGWVSTCEVSVVTPNWTDFPVPEDWIQTNAE